MNFFDEERKFSENLSLNILRECGINSKLNNEKNITDVDIVTENGKKIDVQLSTNFALYGDFRLDIVSAFSPPIVNKQNNIYKYNLKENFLKNFSHKFKCVIHKPGKIMQKDYLDFFFILFYNNKFTKSYPDYVFIISTKEMLGFMKDRREDLFEKIKINDKSKLDDRCGSAFIPISVKELKDNCACFFGSLQELYAHKSYIKSYIG